MRLVALVLLLAACDPYRDGERLLVHSDPRAAAAAIHPRDARGHELRARALLAAHELDEARLEARMALAIRPRTAEAWLLLARIEKDAGRPGAAVVAADAAAERSPERTDFDGLRAELHLLRAQKLAQLGHGPAAEAERKWIARWDPNLRVELPKAALAAGGAEVDPQLAQHVRAWAAAGAHQRAIEAALDWIAVEPSAFVRGPAGIALLESIGEREPALEVAEQMSREDPSDVGARLQVARLYLALGRAPRAQQEIDEAIYLATDRPAAIRRAAEVLEGAGQRRQACALLSRVLNYGAHADNLRALGECLQRDGQQAQAQSILDRARALEPGTATGTGSTPASH